MKHIEELTRQPRCESALPEDSRYAPTDNGNSVLGVHTFSEEVEAAVGFVLGVEVDWDQEVVRAVYFGSRVAECDNLAIHFTKATSPLPSIAMHVLPTKATSQDSVHIAQLRRHVEYEIRAMALRQLSALEADNILSQAVRDGVVPRTSRDEVWGYFRGMRPEIFGGSTAWALFNSFTAVLSNATPEVQVRQTLRLSKLFRAMPAGRRP